MEFCNGKQTYSKNEAESLVRRVGRHINKGMRIYKCDTCYGYHLTKKGRQNKRY